MRADHRAGRRFARDPLHRVHQPGSRGHERRPWGELIPAVTVPVRARNRFEWVPASSSCCPVCSPERPGSICSTAWPTPHPAGATSAAWSRSTTSTTGSSRRRIWGCSAWGCGYWFRWQRVARIGSSRTQRPPARTSSACSGYRRRRSTSSRWGSDGRRVDRLARRRPAPGSGRATGRSSSAPAAMRPHKNLTRLLGALALIPSERRPLLVAARLPHRPRATARRRAGRARRRRRRPVPRLGRRRRAGGAIRGRRRASCSRRCTRASACRCSRRWPAGCPSRARTSARSREVAGEAALRVRPRVRAGDRGRDRAPADRPRARRSGCATPAASAPRSSRWTATAAGTLALLRAGGQTVGLERRSRARVERQPRALRANQSAVESRSAQPASCTRTIAAASSSGDADGATNPLSPSSTSSTAALSGPATTMLGVPTHACLDHHQPVALAPRRQQHAERPRHVLVDQLGGDETGHFDDILESEFGEPARSPRAGQDHRRGSSRATAGSALGPARSRGRIAGTRFSGMWRPANRTSGSGTRGGRGSSGPSYSPPGTIVISPVALRRPAARRAAARSRTRAAAPGRRRAGPAIRRSPAGRPRYSRQ